MANVTFVDDWAEALKERVRPVLEELARYAPSWCHEIEVAWYPGLEALAEISIQQEYRKAFLRIGAGTFNREDRIDALLCHEFAHLFTLPMKKVAMRFAEHVFPDGPTPGTKIYDEWVGECCEGATEDLSIVFQELLRG